MALRKRVICKLMFLSIYIFQEFSARRIKLGTGKGEVAFIVGGWQKRVELFSPEGECQHQLAPVPILGNYFTSPVVGLINQEILVCGGEHNNRNCWKYIMENDSWMLVSQANYTHNGYPGHVYDNKLYILDDKNPEVYDPIANLWSGWPPPPLKVRWGASMCAWKDSLLVFGGRDVPTVVQSYNLTTQRHSEKLY